MQVEFSGKTSLQKIPRYKLAETEEFARLNYMAYDNAAVPRQNLEMNVNTDWQDETFQTGISCRIYNPSFSGGGDNGKLTWFRRIILVTRVQLSVRISTG